MAAAIATTAAVALGSAAVESPDGSGAAATADRRREPVPLPTGAERERLRETRGLDDVLSRSAPRATSGTVRREPAWLEGCRTAPQATLGGNGTVPEESLCELPGGFHLRGDAAAAWARLDLAYTARFGEEPCVTGGYRDLATQRSLYAVKPGLAARPGTSNHGWGVALDLCGGVESFGTVEYRWMTENGPAAGWVNPSWARAGGSRPEPWHWEYVGS